MSGPSSAFEIIFWGEQSSICSDHKALESIGNVGDHKARVQRWHEFFTTFDYTHLSTTRTAPTEKRIFCRVCQGLPRNTTAVGLPASYDGRIFFIWVCGFRIRSLPTPVVSALMGWSPALRVLCWRGSLSPLLISPIFTHTGAYEH